MSQPASHSTGARADRETAHARVALVVGAHAQPRWVADLARRLQRDPALDVFVLYDRDVVHGDARERARANGALYALFARFDDRRIDPGKDPRRLEDLADTVDPERWLDLSHGDARFTLGVFLGDGVPGSALRARCERGVLSVRQPGAGEREHAIPGVREVVGGKATMHTEVLLWRVEIDAPVVVQTSCMRTDRLSPAASTTHYLRNVARLLSDSVAALVRNCAPANSGDPDPAGSDDAKIRVGSLDVTRALARMSALRVERAVRARLQQEDWALAVVRTRSPRSPLDYDPQQPGARPSILLPPPGTIWADPFPVRKDGRVHVFFEEMKRGPRSLGHISVMELDASGEPKSVHPVLGAAYHLSYPFIFEWQGSWFMLPETEQNRSVEVYRCRSWPDDWTLESVLLDHVSAADATIVEAEGTWWLFTTMNPERDVDWDTNLYLYHAPTPLGPWQPHPCNPVKSDVRSARGAGRMFWRDGRLYRPAQNCAQRYGHALAFNEVVQLSRSAFRERTVGGIMPWSRSVVGVHTVNQDGDLLFLDCRIRRRRNRSVDA